MAIATFDDIVKGSAPEVRMVQCGSLVTEAAVYDGMCFVRNYERGNLFLPVSLLEIADMREYHRDDYAERIRALRLAELYKMAITDESLPAGIEENAHLSLFHDPFFCRQFMIMWLGEIGYSPACPDLREALHHDLRWEIRSASAEALGKIGDKGYTGDLVQAAKNDKHANVSGSALKALGAMKDDAALTELGEMVRDGIVDYYRGRFARDRDMVQRGMDRILTVSQTLNKIGEKGKEMLAGFSGENDFWIRWSIGKGIEYSGIQ